MVSYVNADNKTIEIDVSKFSEKEFANFIKLLLVEKYKDVNKVHVYLNSDTYYISLGDVIQRDYNIQIEPQYFFTE